MKIGVLSTWNVSCGIALHAELITRCWVKKGCDVTVLAPHERQRPLHSKDELYVKRCYTLPTYRPYLHPQRLPAEIMFDVSPFLSDFDLFMVEGLGIMPMKELQGVWESLKRRAKTVLVVHEAYTPPNPLFRKFKFDAVVCFDERYKTAFLNDMYPQSEIHVIPYPCHPLKKGDKRNARRALKLPFNGKIVFNYGIGVFRHIHLLPIMEMLSREYPILFLVVTGVKEWHQLFETLKSRYGFIELRRGPLSFDELYDYLHASDLLLIHRDWGRGVVVSSTVHKCLGALSPILVHDTNFVEELTAEVIKYHTDELSERIEDVFKGRSYIENVLGKAREFVKKRSDQIIAEKFMQLFSKI